MGRHKNQFTMKVFIALCLVAYAAAQYLDPSVNDFKELDVLLAARNLSYIVAGKPAKECEFPSIVTLNILKNNQGFLCGGTLVDSTHVITASHCVASGVRAIRVVMGTINSNFPKTIGVVKTITPHEIFFSTARALHNDVAMLTLRDPVTFTDCVKPMPLASRGESFEGKTCVTAGWGKTSWINPPSTVLNKVELPIMSYKECHMIWPHIGHEHICAGDWIDGGASPCQGDSGGPLYCPSKSGETVLAGLVSFGLKCEYGPALYTNVAYFRDWIDRHMK